jgi:hypothetical protein
MARDLAASPSASEPSRPDRWFTLLVAAAYSAITVVMTWPVAPRAATDSVPDFGDSLLNAWILGWNGKTLLALLHGDLSAWRNYWNANIFHPEKLALTCSEHLFAQGVQGLPIYAATGNLLLTHNLLFLSTFVLSALGVYLLVRDLTGSRGAAFVAGLLYGFAPYRINQFTHLQVLSSQWMPFVFFFLRRFFVTRRWPYVVLATTALVAQNLSCGYYLVYFAPFVSLYVLYELTDRGLWRAPRVLAGVAVTAVLTALLTWPFLSPYLEARAEGRDARPRGEIEGYSADVYAYLTANEQQRVWAPWMHVFRKPEGELFPGVLPVALSVVALAAAARAARRRAVEERAPVHGWRRGVVIVAAGVAALQLLALLVAALTGGAGWNLGPLTIRMRSLDRPLALGLIAIVIVLALSARARALLRGRRGSLAAFCLIGLMLAVTLSFGPRIRAMGRSVGTGPYAYLHAYVPGYDGLRVPARHAMLGALFLAVLGGLGADVVRRRLRHGGVVLALIGGAFLVEAASMPVTTNWTTEEDGYVRLPDHVETVNPPPVYAYLATLPTGTVVAEFPFGPTGWELRYVYYSTVHWHPIVNGYSGYFPDGYFRRASRLLQPLKDPDASWAALLQGETTHVVLHEWAYRGDGAAPIRDWLTSRGAQTVAAFDHDVVLRMPGR